MFSTLTNVVKAATAIVASPIAVVADLVTLPSSAYDGRHPFERTAHLMAAAKRCMDAATTPSTPKEPK